jgi:dolichyl-phosphate beta-glucosyltransferase
MSVVVPCYNEAERLYVMLSDMRGFILEYPGYVRELILVDDGSKDGTVEIALQMTRHFPVEVKVVPCAENRGKWSAIHEGMRVAKGEVIMLIDADGSVRMRELIQLHRYLPIWILKNNIVLRKQVYVGSRFKGVVEGKTWLRAVISRVYAGYAKAMLRYATGRGTVDDPQCPIKVFPREMVVGVEWQIERFAGDCELLAELARKGAFFKSWGIHFIHMRGSKIRSNTVWGMMKDTWRVAKMYRNKRYI